ERPVDASDREAFSQRRRFQPIGVVYPYDVDATHPRKDREVDDLRDRAGSNDGDPGRRGRGRHLPPLLKTIVSSIRGVGRNHAPLIPTLPYRTSLASMYRASTPTCSVRPTPNVT